jgi:hypothetical protein
MSDLVLRVNPILCDAHGLCAELLPERIELDAIRQRLGFETRIPAEPPEAEVGVNGRRVYPQSLRAGRTRFLDELRQRAGASTKIDFGDGRAVGCTKEREVGEQAQHVSESRG